MDTFRTNSPFDKNDFIRGSLIKWEFHWRKNRKQLINCSITSIIILLIGILPRNENEPTNPVMFIGIGLSIITLLLIYVRVSSKQRYTRKLKETAERFDMVKMDCSYEFSDESIKYCDKEKKLEFSWSVFTGYTIYKNYLIIILGDSLIQYYIFEKKETDIDEYNKILEIVESNLENKKLK